MEPVCCFWTKAHIQLRDKHADKEISNCEQGTKFRRGFCCAAIFLYRQNLLKKKKKDKADYICSYVSWYDICQKCLDDLSACISIMCTFQNHSLTPTHCIKNSGSDSFIWNWCLKPISSTYLSWKFSQDTKCAATDD